MWRSQTKARGMRVVVKHQHGPSFVKWHVEQPSAGVTASGLGGLTAGAWLEVVVQHDHEKERPAV